MTPGIDIKFTYRDYCLLPEGDRRELLEGELVVTPAPSEKHQRISRNLTIELGLFLRQTDLGTLYCAPFDVILDEHNCVQPDLLVVLNQHRKRLSERGLEGSPDLVVEILSPSTSARDLELKRRLYARFNVPEYWAIDPADETVQIMHGIGEARLFSREELLESRTLPGLRLIMKDLLAP